MATDAPWGQQASEYHAREDRRMLDRLPLQAGVVGINDLRITPVSGLQLQAAAGDAWVAGTHAGVTRQGLYPVGLGAAETGITVLAAHATLPRIDQVVLRVRDAAPAPATAGDAENTGRFEVWGGTATAGATLDNRTGAAGLPASCIRLADILVPAAFAGPFVQGTHIRDRRPWALGARAVSTYTGGDVTVSTTYSAIPASLSMRIESSGNPLLIRPNFMYTGGSNFIDVRLTSNGSAVASKQVQIGAGSSTWGQTVGGTWIYQPVAGSYVITFEHKTSVSTGTFFGSTAYSAALTIEEMLSASVGNPGA